MAYLSEPIQGQERPDIEPLILWLVHNLVYLLNHSQICVPSGNLIMSFLYWTGTEILYPENQH